MKSKIFFIFLILVSFLIMGAKPIIEVPDLPQKSELEMYEDSEGLFAMKIMEYYKMAVALESQLKLSEITPLTKVLQPTYEELEDMDFKIMRKYHKIAKSLEGEVLASPESDRQILLEKINELEGRLRDTIAIYTIEMGAVRNQMLDLMIKRLREIEEKNSENLSLIIEQNFVNCKDYITWLSIGGISKTFIISGNDVVRNDPGIGIQVAFNAGKMIGFWNGFELKYEYFAPKFFTQYQTQPEQRNIPRDQWNINANSISAGGKAVLGSSPKLVHGLNINLGYMWSDGRIYNRSDSRLNWDAALLSLEYFAASPSCKFPFEIFGGISVYNSLSRNLLFQTSIPGFENTDLGRTIISANVGLRYNVWRSPF
ncbi:MAG: hypothetical protein KIT33_04225 [Candidatus Kapabacteria bacterium]|nr:hypothetical protein [Ignavibacteriota bacterium]MCW5884162.1 hypothetical protein [Candidatus Kapabacteria bacterium]